jgi:hypothetical protein
VAVPPIPRGPAPPISRFRPYQWRPSWPPKFSYPTSCRKPPSRSSAIAASTSPSIPKLGKDKEKLLEVIGQYDGLAIRSATKVTEKLIAAATNLKVIGRAGIGVDNVDIPAASRRASSS